MTERRKNKGRTDERGRSDDRVGGISDPFADDLIDSAFPTADEDSTEVDCNPLIEGMPNEAFAASPTEFSGFLESLFETEEELDATLDRLSPTTQAEGAAMVRQVRALVPEDLLGAGGASCFIDQVFSVFDEIEDVLSSFQNEVTSSDHDILEPSTAVVSEAVLADPTELIRAIDRLDDESQKLDLLFRQAKHALHHLRAYRLTKRPNGKLLKEMRRANHIPTLQYVVDFLHSIHQAASNFEALELPRPHIRDYLEHLYHLNDWNNMADLVRRLEHAVRRYSSEN